MKEKKLYICVFIFFHHVIDILLRKL